MTLKVPKWNIEFPLGAMEEDIQRWKERMYEMLRVPKEYLYGSYTYPAVRSMQPYGTNLEQVLWGRRGPSEDVTEIKEFKAGLESVT